MGNNVALFGRSGSGKTTVAEAFVRRGYQHISTGAACRRLTKELFLSESKAMTNKVTDALRAIDPAVWLNLALRVADGRPIVLDSMRFASDYRYLRERNFYLLRVTAPLSIRSSRLAKRGQIFDPATDELHPSERELEACDFDASFANEGSLADIEAWVESVVAHLRA